MNYLKLAWRNIWRNRRRTLITTSSILFALLFALILRSMQLGTYGNMINNLVQVYTGYIQIHKKGYWNEKVIDNSFLSDDTLLKKIEQIRNISMVVPRLESFALASFSQQTKGIALVGINPEKEDKMTHLSKKLAEGAFLKKTDEGVMIAQELAENLQIKVNDTLILISQGYHGENAAGKYQVKGILHFSLPDLDNEMVYMNLPVCQVFYSAPDRLTSISINIRNQDLIKLTATDIRNMLNNGNYEVMTWDQMLLEIVQAIKLDNISGSIYLFILYGIVAFGVFGTVLMMTTERLKEFGVMISIGMQKTKLELIVTLEMLILGIIGIFTGICISLPIIIYYHFNPIRMAGNAAMKAENFGIEPLLCFALQKDFIINQSFVVFIIVLLSIIYPVSKIFRLNIIKALRKK